MSARAKLLLDAGREQLESEGVDDDGNYDFGDSFGGKKLVDQAQMSHQGSSSGGKGSRPVGSPGARSSRQSPGIASSTTRRAHDILMKRTGGGGSGGIGGGGGHSPLLASPSTTTGRGPPRSSSTGVSGSHKYDAMEVGRNSDGNPTRQYRALTPSRHLVAPLASASPETAGVLNFHAAYPSKDTLPATKTSEGKEGQMEDKFKALSKPMPVVPPRQHQVPQLKSVIKHQFSLDVDKDLSSPAAAAAAGGHNTDSYSAAAPPPPSTTTLVDLNDTNRNKTTTIDVNNNPRSVLTHSSSGSSVVGNPLGGGIPPTMPLFSSSSGAGGAAVTQQQQQQYSTIYRSNNNNNNNGNYQRRQHVPLSSLVPVRPPPLSRGGEKARREEEKHQLEKQKKDQKEKREDSQAAVAEEERRRRSTQWPDALPTYQHDASLSRGGFQNIGNTCYAGSVLTLILRSPSFQTIFGAGGLFVTCCTALKHVLGSRKNSTVQFPFGSFNDIMVDWPKGLQTKLVTIQIDVEVGRVLNEERRKKRVLLPLRSPSRSAESVAISAADIGIRFSGSHLMPALLVANTSDTATATALPFLEEEEASSPLRRRRPLYLNPAEQQRAVVLRDELRKHYMDYEMQVKETLKKLKRKKKGKIGSAHNNVDTTSDEDDNSIRIDKPEWLFTYPGDSEEGAPMGTLFLRQVVPLHTALYRLIIQMQSPGGGGVTPGILQETMGSFFDMDQHDAHEFMVMLLDKLEEEWQHLGRTEERLTGFLFRILNGVGVNDGHVSPIIVAGRSEGETHAYEAWDKNVEHLETLRQLRSKLLGLGGERSCDGSTPPSHTDAASSPRPPSGTGTSETNEQVAMVVGKKRDRIAATASDASHMLLTETICEGGASQKEQEQLLCDATASATSVSWLRASVNGDLLQTVTCWRRGGVCGNINYSREPFGVVSVCVPKLTPQDRAAQQQDHQRQIQQHQQFGDWNTRFKKPVYKLDVENPPFAIPTVQEMLTHDLADSSIEGYKCDGCGSRKRQYQQSRFIGPLPPSVIVHLKRYEAKWVKGEFMTDKNPRPVNLSEVLTLTSYDLQREVVRVLVSSEDADAPKKKKRRTEIQEPSSACAEAVSAANEVPLSSEELVETKIMERKVRRYSAQFKLSGVLRHLGSSPYTGHYMSELCHRYLKRPSSSPAKQGDVEERREDTTGGLQRSPQSSTSTTPRRPPFMNEESQRELYTEMDFTGDHPGDWVRYNDSSVSQISEDSRPEMYDRSTDGYILRYDIIPGSEVVVSLVEGEEEQAFHRFRQGLEDAVDPYPNASDEESDADEKEVRPSHGDPLNVDDAMPLDLPATPTDQVAAANDLFAFSPHNNKIHNKDERDDADDGGAAGIAAGIDYSGALRSHQLSSSSYSLRSGGGAATGGNSSNQGSFGKDYYYCEEEADVDPLVTVKADGDNNGAEDMLKLFLNSD